VEPIAVLGAALRGRAGFHELRLACQLAQHTIPPAERDAHRRAICNGRGPHELHENLLLAALGLGIAPGACGEFQFAQTCSDFER